MFEVLLFLINIMKTVYTNKAPEPVGPYSQAIIVNNLIFTAGQIGIDPSTNQLVDGIEKQTHQVLENLKNVLEAAGSSIEKVIKTTIYLKDINQFQIVNGIYEKYFKNQKPARSTVEVNNLPKDALIEIEMVAST